MIVLLDNIFIIRKLQLGNNLLPKFLLFLKINLFLSKVVNFRLYLCSEF